MQFFSIIGFQRCGSTYLYDLLDHHPDVLMNIPKRPEPKFFIENFDIKDKGMYMDKYFPSLNNKYKVFGDKSTSYCESVNTLKNLKSFFPNAKIIVILRNPVDRALSNYKFSLENKLEKRSLKEVFIDEIESKILEGNYSVNPNNYLERGFYSTYLERIYSVFDKNKVHLICFEELLKNEEHELRKLATFLDIPFIGFRKIGKSNNSKFNIEVSKEIRNKLTSIYNKEIKKLTAITNLNLNSWSIDV